MYDPDPTCGNASFLGTILSNVQPIVLKAFGAVATGEFGIYFVQVTLRGGTLDGALTDFVWKVFKLCSAGAFVANVQTWYPMLFNYFASIGASFANTSASSFYAAKGVTYFAPPTMEPTPGSLVDAGFNIVFGLLLPPGGSNPLQVIMAMFSNVGLMIIIVPALLMILSSFGIPAIMLGVVWVQFTVFSYGTILLAALGSRMFSNIGMQVIHLGITLGIKAMGLIGYAGLMFSFAQWIVTTFQVTPPPLTLLVTTIWNVLTLNGSGLVEDMTVAGHSIFAWIEIMCASVVMGFVGMMIPKGVEGWLTGSPTISMGDFIKRAATAVAIAAAPVIAGANMNQALAMGGFGGGGSGAGLPGNALGPGSGAGAGAPAVTGGGAGSGGGGGGWGPGTEGGRKMLIASEAAKSFTGTLSEMAGLFDTTRGSVSSNTSHLERV